MTGYIRYRPGVVTLSFLFHLITFYPMAAQSPGTCDPATGLCYPYPAEASAPPPEIASTGREIIYVGDPMCSWCWGISPALNRLKHEAEQAGMTYRIVVGGLRPGGGDPWTTQFKEFLQHHWEEVHERSGQPFGYDLFERAQFEYDTEPACRAVVATRTMDPAVESRFFEWVQHYFYVQNQDPKSVEFYEPICQAMNLDFKTFSDLFESEAIRQATQADFQLNRQWGVRGFPTVIFRDGDKLYAIARGFATFEQMWAAVEQLSQEQD
ncbi:MAG: DsbA family protein [Phaeodactylibacter sp.]|nr:DsbA family protein [Phaeodactylibacter sp.]